MKADSAFTILHEGNSEKKGNTSNIQKQCRGAETENEKCSLGKL